MVLGFQGPETAGRQTWGRTKGEGLFAYSSSVISGLMSLSPVKGEFISCRSAEKRELFLGLLLLNCFQLKIILMSKRHIWG